MPWAAITAAATVGGALMQSDAVSNAADKQAAGTDRAISSTERLANQNRADLAPYREAGTAALTRLRSLLGIGAETQAPSLTSQGPSGTTFNPALINHPEYNDAWQSIFGGPGQGDSRTWSQSDLEAALRSKLSPDYLKSITPQAPASSDSGSLLSKFSTADLNADPVYNSGLQFGLDEGTKALERRAAAGGGYDSGAELKALTRYGNDYGSTKADAAYGRFTSDQDRTFGKLTGVAGMGSGATTVGVGADASASSNLANLYTGGANAAGAASIAGGNAISGGLNNLSQYAMLSQLSGAGRGVGTASSPSPSYPPIDS